MNMLFLASSMQLCEQNDHFPRKTSGAGCLIGFWVITLSGRMLYLLPSKLLRESDCYYPVIHARTNASGKLCLTHARRDSGLEAT